MKFNIGDKVVHPQHGVGYVEDIEEKQFEPKVTRTYFVVKIPDTTLWVPVDLNGSGLRKLSDRNDLEECRQVLQSLPQALKPDRGLVGILSKRINLGTIVAHCEVIRDLTAFGWRKPLYGPPADFKRNILNVLYQEWSILDEVSQGEASNEITALLGKGRAAHEQ